MSKIFCPFCLTNVELEEMDVAGKMEKVCPEPKCKKVIPALYLQETKDPLPIIVISGVGFSRHGKTVFFSSLLHAIYRELPHYWDNFHIMPGNRDSFLTIEDNQFELEAGMLPQATQRNFPEPTIIFFYNMPGHPRGLLLFYDTSGEAFRDAGDIETYARFVQHSRVVTFFLSLPELMKEGGNLDSRAHELLFHYVSGMARMGGQSQQQDLVVVVTKADCLIDRLAQSNGDLLDYLRHGHEGLEGPYEYFRRLKANSKKVEAFLCQALGGNMFVHAARDTKFFRSVDYCLISSLGAEPQNKEVTKTIVARNARKVVTSYPLSARVLPRRVMDPIILVMDKYAPFKRPGFFRRIFAWIFAIC